MTKEVLTANPDSKEVESVVKVVRICMRIKIDAQVTEEAYCTHVVISTKP